MPVNGQSHIRIARPTRDLTAAERFWVDGLGLSVVYRADGGEELVARLEEHGGKRVTSPNPYWNEWGVTVEDPDGYRLVLSTRAWSNS